MIGHALIHVLPDGGFQLETKTEVHRSLDALLASLEPDVELSASYFNTAVKKRPALPSKAGAPATGGNQSANSAAVSEIALLFPEKSDDEIAAAVARANGDQAQAIDFLTASASNDAPVPASPAHAPSTQYAQVPSGLHLPGRVGGGGRGGPASNGPGRAPLSASVGSVSRGGGAMAPATRGPFGAAAAARGGGAGMPPSRAGGPGAPRGGGAAGAGGGRGAPMLNSGAAAIAAGPASLRRAPAPAGATAATAAATPVDESLRSNDSVDMSDLDALADFSDVLGGGDGKANGDAKPKDDNSSVQWTNPWQGPGIAKPSSSGGGGAAAAASTTTVTDDLDALDFDLESIAASKPPPKQSPATPAKNPALAASLSPALPEKSAAAVAAVSSVGSTASTSTAAAAAATTGDEAGGASTYAPTALLDDDPNSNKPDYKKKAAEKVTEDLILVEEEGQVYVKAGTLERLVQRVTTDEYADINFMLQFLLTYRSFTTHDGLLAELIKRYDEACPPGQDAKEWNEKLVKIRLRVVNLLRTWVTKHWVDFDGNPELQGKVEKFVETTVSASNASLASNLIKGMRSKQADEVKKKTVVFSSKAPKSLAPLDKPINAEFGWMDYHATEIARQLTLIEYEMYKSITPFEFLENGWSRKDKEKRAPNILRMTRRFNMVSQWVQSQMCTRTDFRERVHMLQRFIEVAERLRDLNNLNGVSEIVSGLNSSPVHRLKMTWAALPQRSRDVFAQLDAIMQPNGAYKAFRDYLHTCRPPCIAEGTPVTLADGTARRIEELVELCNARVPLHLAAPRVADSDSDVAVGFEAAVCSAAWFVDVKRCVALTLQDGRELVCTPDHRLLTADGRWLAAADVKLGYTRLAVAPLDAPLDERAPDERRFALDTGVGVLRMDSEAARAATLAFARVLGFVCGGGAVRHALDGASLRRDVRRFAPKCEPQTRVGGRFEVRGELLRCDVARLAAAAPLSVVREFVAAAVGGAAAQRVNVARVEVVLGAGALDARLLAAMLARLGVDAVVGADAVTIGNVQFFAERVGVRHNADAQRLLATRHCAKTRAASAHERVRPAMALLVTGRRDAGARRVYDVSVPRNEAFVANGVAVHNCIPYLGVYLTDLTFIEDGCKDVVMQGDKGNEVKLVNFEKCRKTARAIQEISQYQDTPFNLTTIDYMRDALLELGFDSVDNNYKKSLELEARGNDNADIDIRASRAAPKKERFTERDRFIAHSSLASAKLPDNLVYEAKSALSVMDATLEVIQSEPTAFRISGPTADERRTTKDYVLKAESVQEMAEWLQALLMAGASGDASLSDLLALFNVYDRAGDVKAGFLSMRGAQVLLKQSFSRSWFVLDKRQQLLWHGPLVVPYPDIDPLSTPPEDRCVFTPALFAGGATPSGDDLFACNSCAAEESQLQGNVTQYNVCTACVINCHSEHDMLVARRKPDSVKSAACACRRCVRKLYKGEKKAIDKPAPGKAAPAGGAGGANVGDDNDDDDPRQMRKKPSFMTGKGIKGLFNRAKGRDSPTSGGLPKPDTPTPQTTTAASPTPATTLTPTPSSSTLPTVNASAAASAAANNNDSVSPLASPRLGANAAAAPAPAAAAAAAATADGDGGDGVRSPRLPAGVLEVARVVQAYEAEEANELTIELDDEVNVYRKNEDTGWWLCELRSGPNAGKKGWCPSSFCETIPK
jgi:hypothetical protein